MTDFGLKDIPISRSEDEALGLAEYADALAEFIARCDTPMTVALQGDWGSGKTSLMQLIKEMLPSFSREEIHTVWFNTWQYSQFNMADALGVSMLSRLISELEVGDSGNNAKKVLKKLAWSTFKIAGTVGASIVGQGDAAKEAAQGLESEFRPEDLDPAQQIAQLKEDLEVLVHKRTGGRSRVVVFVDDLDRLLPVRAVELLECMKLFMDLEGCVFVLACDYQVVAKGLKQKFGLSEGDLDGKSFFDKMIQVPFNMPLSQYSVERYFGRLLDGIGVPFGDDDIPIYVDLVNYSAGFNPRSMKRLFNSLLLLRLVAKRKGLFTDTTTQTTRAEDLRILFAVLCMQFAWEPMYNHLQQQQLTEELFDKLKDEDQLKDETALAQSGLRLEDELQRQKLADFMDSFMNAMQLASDGDDALSQSELDHLAMILKFSAVVSTDATVQPLEGTAARRENREMAKAFIPELEDRFQPLLRDTPADAGFSLYQRKIRGDASVSVGLRRLNFKESDPQMSLFSSLVDDWMVIILGGRTKSKDVPFCREWAQQHIAPHFPDYGPPKVDYGPLLFAVPIAEQLAAELTPVERHQRFKEWTMEQFEVILGIYREEEGGDVSRVSS